MSFWQRRDGRRFGQNEGRRATRASANSQIPLGHPGSRRDGEAFGENGRSRANRGSGDSWTPQSPLGHNRRNRRCWHCGNLGHVRRHCPEFFMRGVALAIMRQNHQATPEMVAEIILLLLTQI
ncbi:hypothetical protein N7457_006177 [Penicillium paradoxum]|uniref:uncharacterized protein n=1 Tax=Penicillium paradoxum TaxID=176176 RepID=UPI002549B372|nr:uncharacterized protein N7457_006177 [Penicillium paradoxum]KAJ5781017.1 hypothetical protein N7457_006177 [Penicillium paradoxum]